MTESFENLLTQILVSNPKIEREELLSMVERKKQESHGLLSDEGAIRLLAQQLSNTAFPTQDLGDQRISSVQAGLNNVTITGQIISVGDVREFQRPDGTSGKLLRMSIGDQSGQITCVAWDSMVDVVRKEPLSARSKVRVLHGYTKFGMAGEVELHLGSRASFQILSRDGTAPDFDPNSPIARLQKLGRSEELQIRLLRIQKSQSENGPTWALCNGESGLLIAKFWDEQARDVLSLGEGCLVTVRDHWVTERNGMLYVNVGSKSTVKKQSADFVSDIPVSSVSSLKPGPLLWTVTGNVVESGEIREIQTREGRRTRVSNINLEDDTGRIRVSFWDAHAQKAESLRVGDSLRLVGVKVRENMNGEKEASTVFLTQIEKA